MKKILLTIFALATVGANAQFAPGSTAPDFTATDIYGNSHSLYTDYLNEGKHVLLNVSATWCGPCWNYHNTHFLADFYEAYGPNGSDEAIVLYVEGDPSTPVNAIFGAGNNTWGDWTEGTPYPIIDSGSVANQYHAPYTQPYFPMIFRICSSGILTEINQLTASGLRNSFSNNCSTLTGVPNHAYVRTQDVYTCGSDLAVKLTNLGNNNITSAVLVLKEDGNVIDTQTFSGNVTQFNKGTVTFSSVINEDSDYVIEIQSLNDVAPHYGYGETEINVIISKTVEKVGLQVNVYTDNYPSEISWKIKNSAGTVIANGGPYQAGTNDQFGGGGPDANTTKIHNIVVTPSECYSVELYDSYGDGWVYNSTAAPVSGLEIFENGTSVVFVNGNGNFGGINPNTAPELVRPSAFKTGATLGAENFQIVEFSVYPNPSTGIFNISTSEVVKINVVDITGKVIYQASSVQGDTVINLSNLQSGVYLMNVSGENINKTEKLIIK